MNLQRIVLAGLPVFFYFVPNILITSFYKKYVKDIYFKFAKDSEDEYYNIKDLDTKFSRIISFVAFLSIGSITIATLSFSKIFQINFISNCYCFSVSIVFVLLSAFNTVINFKQKLSLGRLEEYSEIFIVILSSILIYKFS